MKQGGGKAKGAAFERKVCEALSLWQSNGQNHDWYWRSAMSGGRATVAKKSGKSLKTQCGDITAIDPQGAPFTDKFFVEVKHVKSYKLDRFVLYNKGPMAKAWEICQKEALNYNKHPMLIANLGPLGIVMLLPAYFSFLGRENCWQVVVLGNECSIYLFKQILDEWEWDSGPKEGTNV